MRIDKSLDSSYRVHEIAGEVREGCLTDYDQQRDAISNDGGKFVRRVADSLIVCDGNPAVLSAVLQPLLVGTVGWKEIAMTFHGQSGINENLRKLLTEVTVSKVDVAHAARS